jgi:kynurenine formamidase
MIATIDRINIDLSKPIDISIPLTSNGQNPIAWYLEQPEIKPVQVGDWVGKVTEGSSTNFNNIFFNPHGHGTHTECLGHITHAFFSINQCLKQFFFKAQLISIAPEQTGDDKIITKEQIKIALAGKNPEAVVIRTFPNETQKKTNNYSHPNPPYLAEDADIYLREIGVKHLLIDLPSVDREEDEGKLLAHKAFWNVKNTKDINPDVRLDCTITELIFVDDAIKDGNYMLNLQIASFENDAAPSKPILYEIRV